VFFVIEVAAANLTLAKDMLSEGMDVNGNIANIKKAPYNRAIRRLGLTGSAAAEDMWVEVQVNGEPHARIHNTITGVPVGWEKDAAILMNPIPVPANAELTVKIIDAGGTNNAYLILEF